LQADEQQQDLGNDGQGEMTPRQFAVAYSVNVQNVYYWCHQRGLGHKSGKFIYLSDEDVAELQRINAERSMSRKYGRNPDSKRMRKRATESVDSIRAKLQLEDKPTARLIAMLLSTDESDKLLGAIRSFCVVNKEMADTFTHDKVLVIIGKLLGRSAIGEITVPDGVPFFKFVDPQAKGDYTVIYNIRNRVYYLDAPYRVIEQNPDLAIRTPVLRIPTES